MDRCFCRRTRLSALKFQQSINKFLRKKRASVEKDASVNMASNFEERPANMIPPSLLPEPQIQRPQAGHRYFVFARDIL
ncbi:Malignant fibrous histiocytoma-amplified sequence 1 [Gossypium arboreum]|uniref:Malignant fibrous histiocytoma-amplified sequence 1 n=1 Tax=Gossypium arboreum TaxID=29729 RepID=A0A0B0NCU1_GOSAR|nr:Malignant fibrous histiocytoma-amplified sequence 1 [Gossypium arboreum]